MRGALLAILVVLIVLTDIASAAIYAATDWEQVVWLRLAREALAGALAAWGLLSPRLPPGLRWSAVAYFGMTATYALMQLADDSDTSLVLASAARLGVPVIFLLAGLAAADSPSRTRWPFVPMIALGLASTLFGYWDRANTEFWTDVIAYGDYLWDIKGVFEGYDPEDFLPFNFFGFEGSRRAAGLPAAPLAQGSYLATAAAFGYAFLRRRSFPAAAGVLVICSLGVLASGTRGAVLMLAVALPIQLLLTARTLPRLVSGLGVLVVVGGLGAGSMGTMISYTLGLQDGSTVGHIDALSANIADIGSVILVGEGVGEAGGERADLGLELAGGGEGAFFTIAYQIGVPGALLFLLLYGLVVHRLVRAAQGSDGIAELAAAGAGLMVGAATSLIVSEHVLTVSGMGPMWVAVGAVLGAAASAGARQDDR